MSDSAIKEIRARQILDSRGRPTVEVDVVLSDEGFGRAAVPSGASTGTFEACELRDGDKDFYEGLGVRKAVENVNTEIFGKLKGKNAFAQRAIDEFLTELDGTENYTRLGANAVLGVSLAVARASANSLKIPLYRRIAELSETENISMPLPMVNILSGGLHAGRGMDVQDFLFIPASAESLSEAVHRIFRVRSAADKAAEENGISTLLADEGGLSPGFENGRLALKFMMKVFEKAKLKPFEEALIAVDVAAGTLQTIQNNYYFLREDRRYTAIEIIELAKEWTRDFPLFSIEDALGEEDWAHWTLLNEQLGGSVQIVGDDLFATNLKRVEKGIKEKATNAVLVKLNQNGTLTGTLDVIKKAKANNLRTIVSARSGETEDDFIADLAVGTSAGQIKIGSFRNSERLSKYNQLLRIEAESGAEFSVFDAL